MPLVVIRTCYDGDQFGEVSHFAKNIEKINSMIGIDTNTQEQIDLQNRGSYASMFERKLRVSDEMLKDLTQEEVEMLNQQRTTATTCESCDLLYINKLQSMFIIGKGMQDDIFQERLKFLWTLDLFKGINRNHLLPLITNLDIRSFRKGEFIQREGDEPEGLILIKDGCAIVCTNKLAMRRVDGAKQLYSLDSFGAREI